MKSKKIKGHKVNEKLLQKSVAGFFIKNGKAYSARQVLKKLKVANSKNDIVNVIDKLVKQGLLKPAGDNKFILARARRKTVDQENTYIGEVDKTRSGAAPQSSINFSGASSSKKSI